MALVKTPYEQLTRWSPDGKVSGMHIKFLETFKDDVTGEVIFQREGQAEHVSMAGELGFPLADVLDEIHVSALTTIEAKNAEIQKKDSDAAADKAELAVRDAVLADREATILSMQEATTALQAEMAKKDMLSVELQIQISTLKAQIPA